MKSLSAHQNKSSRAGEPGFTLAEMLIAMGIFSMVIAAMVAVQLFGMRVYTLAATKLSATAGCRKALNVIRDQVREAKLVDIGNCPTGPSDFTNLGLSALQVGNALRISMTNNWTNGYTLFYADSSMATTNYLKQCTVTNIGSSTTPTFLSTNILATYITNQDIFTAQDWTGTTLTNENEVDNTLEAIPNRLVVLMKLQFYQWEYPIAYVGTNSGYGNMYDYYQLRTKITRRAWN